MGSRACNKTFLILQVFVRFSKETHDSGSVAVQSWLRCVLGFRSSAVSAALRFGFRSSAVSAALRFEGGNYASRRSAPASRVDDGL